MRDGVGEHGGEFVLIGGRQNQAGGNEYGSAGKGGGLVNPGLVVIGQFERVGEARGGRLGRDALTEFVEVGIHRGGIDHADLAAILGGELRAEGFFLFDAVLGGKRGAHQKESKPHT